MIYIKEMLLAERVCDLSDVAGAQRSSYPRIATPTPRSPILCDAPTDGTDPGNGYMLLWRKQSHAQNFVANKQNNLECFSTRKYWISKVNLAKN